MNASSVVDVKVDQAPVDVFSFSRMHVIAHPYQVMVLVGAIGLITKGLDAVGMLKV